MRLRAAWILLSSLALIVLIAFVLFWRARSQAAYGPAVALCPGPDHFGYVCEGGAAYAYIDATTPVDLIADDDVARLELPFPFTFYGATYTTLHAASNGNLQFTTRNPLYRPACLAPASDMGDLIAPYWTDLDLTARGALEIAVVGEAPARVFVVEWDDVPVYGTDIDNRVTFEVQLFETSHDVVFLYEDPATVAGGNGGAAVVGIQSERQGLSLSYSCLQPMLPAPGGVRLIYPSEPNPEPPAPGGDPVIAPPAPAAKGPLAELLAAYETRGAAALEPLRLHWLRGQPPRGFVWRAADLAGDGRAELVVAWSGGPRAPELAQLAVLSVGNGDPAVLFDHRLATRAGGYASLHLEATADLTGDGREDVVVRDEKTGTTWVVSAALGEPALVSVPGLCAGGLIVRDGDARPELIRDGCEIPGRLTAVWDGTAFVRVP